jgi:Putative Flp pilus-assembly TadE/G-like
MTKTTRFTQLHRDERGFNLITIGLSLMALFGATMLAIDVGMLMWARTQAQLSADAGALAGATSLAYNSFTDRSPSGPAVTAAISTAKTNHVQGASPSVIPVDVEFPFNTVTSRYDQVQVTVHRTQARPDPGPVPTIIASFFGMANADVTAVAMASAWPADAATCVLPFTLPDKWREVSRCGGGTCTWQPTDTFEILTPQGNHQNVGPGPIANPDVYVPPGNPANPTTGYNAVADKGVRLVLKPHNGSGDQVAPSIYNPYAIPGGTGADYYRENIMGCNTTILEAGTMLMPEPGNMTGPTREGTEGLIASDPGAYWDDGCNCIRGSSARGLSPRVRPIPLYNPERYARWRDNGRSGPEFEIVNYLGFFVQEITGSGDVIGRIHPINGLVTDPGNPYEGAFATAIMLVR